MELKRAYLLYIGIALVVALLVITMRRGRTFKGGRKSANTDYIRTLPQYKRLMFEYRLWIVVMNISLIASILLGSFLMAGPHRVKTITQEIHNRDIFICLDVSTSLDGVNMDMLDEVKGMVSNLKGERFGITIFNAKSVLLVPLTTDYDYVIKTIEDLQDSIEAGTDVYYNYQVDSWVDYGYRFSGTLSNDGGSSYIGDGLATCLYDFPDLDEDPDRSRMILFVTDNELNDINGYSLVTIEQAGQMCAAHNVKVFALAPSFVTDESTFKAAIESTGGAYFNTRDRHAIDDLITKVSNTDVNSYTTTYITENDVPEVATYILVGAILLLSISLWRLKLC